MTMNVIHVNLHNDIQYTKQITACIGYFDGIHLGHQKLIQRVLVIAQETNTTPSLITFNPDPWEVIKDVSDIPHITSMEQRMVIGEALGIQNWIILDFDKTVAGLSIEDFHRLILHRLHIRTLVCGYDFHYSKKGYGDIVSLASDSTFRLEVVDEVSSEYKKISSTRIEELIKLGEVEKAAAFMNRPYEISGTVVDGRKIGRSVGFPTANLLSDEHFVEPHIGVYVGEVWVRDMWHKAIINIGNNPSFNYKEKVSIEAHIFDYDNMIYGEHVVFRFLHFLRGEQTFPNKEAFITQLNQDKEKAYQYFQ